jgi:mono/diheme cytochrome c family protein
MMSDIGESISLSSASQFDFACPRARLPKPLRGYLALGLEWVYHPPMKTRMPPIPLAFILFVVHLAALAGRAEAQGSPLPRTLEFAAVPGLFAANCGACHDWAGSYDSLIGSKRLVPGKPEASVAWQLISTGQMPPSGPGLTESEKRLIGDWIAAGSPPVQTAASESATGAAPPLAASKFLGFSSTTEFHRFSGWASGGILLASGIVGAIHAYDMISASHAFRDANNISEETMGTICSDEIIGVWGSSTEQALRWTHAGLLVAGESFYLANALTGSGMIRPNTPGITKSKLHRWAFFIHAGLMASEAVMGFIASDALRRGDHDTVSSLVPVHAAVGLAIPVIILGAGSIMSR